MTQSTHAIEVLAPGLSTTVQDRGRFGLRHLGVPWAGAADPWAHAIANLLVGNPEDAATLEIALAGPSLRFAAAVRLALCGATIDARIDDTPVPGNRPVDVPAGGTLRLGRCTGGARTYLAVSGGIAVARTLGSASTDLRGGFGGHGDGALCKGDRLACATTIPAPGAIRIARWWVDATPGPSRAARDDGDARTIRLLPGQDRAEGLFDAIWQIGAHSDRQGLRLQGPGLAPADRRERISEPVAPGTVQLPPDGHPIVLLADAQTHGGYPRIGHAIRADWPLLAQARPGDRLRFAPCTPAQARAARAEQRQRLQRLALAIHARQAAA